MPAKRNQAWLLGVVSASSRSFVAMVAYYKTVPLMQIVKIPIRSDINA